MEHNFHDEANNVQNLGGKETIADEYLNVFGAVEILNDRNKIKELWSM